MLLLLFLIIIIIIIIFFYYLFLLLLLNIGHALRLVRIFQKTLQHKTGGPQINVILFWIILTPRHPFIKYILSKLTFISHYLQYLLSIFWFTNTFFCLAEPLCVVVELVSGGSLDKILRSSHVQPERDLPTYSNIWSRLTERELLKIALDVSNGMKHLESKKVRLKSMSWVSSYLKW